MPYDPNMIMCPTCGTKFIPKGSMIEPNGMIRCEKCDTQFKKSIW